MSHHERARQHEESIRRFEDEIRRYRAGELSADQFRPLRLGMGLYAQLAHVKHMQRIKVPGGAVTAEQLEAIAEITARFGRGLAHVTTRQDFQIHHVEIEQSVEVMRLLAAAGVSTVGACADTVRNVTASPYAGVVADEVFDVTPASHALTEHFLFHELNRKLPRKFKIGLSGSARDEAQVVINDLGLFARVVDGRRGFRVLVAGGLGSTPELAHLWRDFVDEADVLAVAEAVVHVFHRDGDRKNRKKNRLKFLLRKLGEAELFARLDRELDEIVAARGDALRSRYAELAAGFVEPAPPAAQPGEPLGDGAFARWKRTNTFEQMQPGYRVVTLKLPLGDVTAEQIREIARLSRDYANGAVRTTNQQNVVLRWVPTARLLELFRELVAVGLAEADALHVTDVVSCPGTDYCSLAITQSMGVGERIRRHLGDAATRTDGDDVVSRLGRFEVKISGCPNSCGQHHVADVGMTGLMVTGKDGVERPHYSLRLGGGCGEDARVGGRIRGRFPEEEAPAVIAAIAKHYLDRRASGESFREFVERVGTDALGDVGIAASPNAV